MPLAGRGATRFLADIAAAYRAAKKADNGGRGGRLAGAGVAH